MRAQCTLLDATGAVLVIADISQANPSPQRVPLAIS